VSEADISGLQTLEVLWQFVLSSIKLPLVLACPAFLAASSTFDFQTHNETRFDALVNPKSHIIANITHLKLKAIPGENAIAAN
jgi:hypothetical protein